ncbi:class I SAM-dependent methyltransferase [Mycobacterium montefiorense]|nr:class I SAM-dependent methyltransferase [Mycobacterium montefiorense]
MARSENDTWDLATSVGATATMVAAGRARATKDKLIDDPFAEPLVRAVGVDFFTRWANGEISAADVDEPGAPWGMQRMTDLLAARTRYIDAFFADTATAGIRQVVILAAGLDARGYRLPWAPGTTVFEIDQPEVIEFKTATIEALGAKPTALSADGSRLVAEIFINTGCNQNALDGATQRWRENGLDVALVDLGFPGERNDAATHLGNLGWQPVNTELNQLLADNGLPLQPDGEDAAFAKNYYCTAVLHKAG